MSNIVICELQMGVVDLMKALPVHLIACLLAQQPQGAGDSLSVCLSAERGHMPCKRHVLTFPNALIFDCKVRHAVTQILIMCKSSCTADLTQNRPLCS